MPERWFIGEISIYDWERVKLFLATLLVGTALCHPVKAQPMFAGYDDFCGIAVIVERNRMNAEATYRNGQPVIILDPGVMANWTLSRIFTLAHECGHHRLGHVSSSGIYARAHLNATSDQELSADCWAAEALAYSGYYAEIERSINDMGRMGHIAQGTYPSGAERAEAIAYCANVNFQTNSLESDQAFPSNDTTQDDYDDDDCRIRKFTHDPCD